MQKNDGPRGLVVELQTNQKTRKFFGTINKVTNKGTGQRARRGGSTCKENKGECFSLTRTERVSGDQRGFNVPPTRSI